MVGCGRKLEADGSTKAHVSCVPAQEVSAGAPRTHGDTPLGNGLTIALCAYMARHYFNWVSLDATNWRIVAEKLKYLNPNLSATRIAIHGVGPIGSSDCKCPMCRNKTYSDMKGLRGKKRRAFLRSFLWVHNRWAIEKALKDSFKNSRSLSSLTRFLKKRSSTQWKIREVCESLAAIVKGTNP